MKLKKLFLVTLTILTMSTFVVGCSDENDEAATTTNNTTTQSEVTTQEPTTKEPESTTEKPTIPEETTKYVYKGIEFCAENKAAEYFNGLILENGDIIYVNDIYPGESYDDDCNRGSIAYAILANFKMEEERILLKDKYWSEGTFTPEIPYSDNYCIKYTGEKVEFVFVEDDGLSSMFDVIPVE